MCSQGPMKPATDVTYKVHVVQRIQEVIRRVRGMETIAAGLVAVARASFFLRLDLLSYNKDDAGDGEGVLVGARNVLDPLKNRKAHSCLAWCRLTLQCPRCMCPWAGGSVPRSLSSITAAPINLVKLAGQPIPHRWPPLSFPSSPASRFTPHSPAWPPRPNPRPQTSALPEANLHSHSRTRTLRLHRHWPLLQSNASFSIHAHVIPFGLPRRRALY
ncbi:hypothetical protein K470DRAFT_140723 [Piedraia hortae CBS 480.64]|uniref:Uncharacterized protein n=1 Tax=Piedraia hortae CBS 480.64 TaxID=1314780 RepID=A0A6A7C7X4_9PEZI|nr:hypothetical protein K470DRAFT_140723 [Piedraia hortae CBS 480.64]